MNHHSATPDLSIQTWTHNNANAKANDHGSDILTIDNAFFFDIVAFAGAPATLADADDFKIERSYFKARLKFPSIHYYFGRCRSSFPSCFVLLPVLLLLLFLTQ